MAHIVLIIISGIITLVAILLIIIYCMNKSFRAFPCYFNIIFTLTIAFNNIIRLIPAGRGTGIDTNEEKTIPCHIQAFTLAFFDKLMLTLMTSYSIISFLGSFQNEFYNKNEKKIFIILTLLSIIITAIPTYLFYSRGISDRSEFCYVETKDPFKQVLDTIVTGALLIISLICIISILVKIYKLKGEINAQGRDSSINFHYIRFIFNLLINFITFTYVILLILKVMPFDNFVKDLLYILLSLSVELFFTVNSKLLKEIKRIITCKSGDIEDEFHNIDDTYNDDENETS